MKLREKVRDRNLVSLKTKVTEHAQAHFPAWAEIFMRLHEVFLNFTPDWNFHISQPWLKVSPCNRKRFFKKICSGDLDETSARAEIRHVIGPLVLNIKRDHSVRVYVKRLGKVT